MKKNIFLILIFFSGYSFSQTPQKMSYQAVVRNSSNLLMANTTIGMRISVLQGTATGTAVFVETHTTTTNTNGLASITIGAGLAITGTFSSISWANGPYFLKSETDIAGGTNYTITGTSEIVSVPYAEYADKVNTNHLQSMFELKSNKNIANGYSGLDANGQINLSQIDTSGNGLVSQSLIKRSSSRFQLLLKDSANNLIGNSELQFRSGIDSEHFNPGKYYKRFYWNFPTNPSFQNLQGGIQVYSTDDFLPSIALFAQGDKVNRFLMRKMSGTITSPTANAGGTLIGQIPFGSYDGSTGFPLAALIEGYTDASTSIGNSSGYLSIQTTPLGSINPQRRILVKNYRTEFTPQALSGNLDTSAISLFQTWNTSGSPNLFSIKINNISSGDSAKFVNYQSNDTSRFSINKDGTIINKADILSAGIHRNSGFISTGNGQISGNLNLTNSGSKINIVAGSNASVGVVNLALGVAIVNTTAVTSNSIIFLTVQDQGIQNGKIRVSSKIAGTSFTITSSDATDNCSIGWFIIN